MYYLFISVFILMLSCSCSDLETLEVQSFLPGPLAKGCSGKSYPEWSSSPYVLPYPVGLTYKTGLTNCLGMHTGTLDQYAVDIDMPIGSKITAAREGKVTYVIESGFDGSHPNNFVIVEHSDNTFAGYMHLTHNGATVNVGDSVVKGQEIGLSGSTGLAGYPHLHFVIAQGQWQFPFISIPVTFKNTLSNKNSLAPYTSYEAFAY
jgi:murein DD-endopeptidase MepM/ murein hydrolase activator NlpD